MSRPFDRRSFLQFAAALPFALSACTSTGLREQEAEAELEALERAASVRLGVFMRDLENGTQIERRANERFPFCSTFKVVLTAAILDRSSREPELLERRIDYAQSDLVSWSPVTEKHVTDGMRVADLCAAAIQYSDNTAANLLIRILGGPSDVTAYARSIGNDTFRLDRWETELNTAIPGDPRDTVTPRAMAGTLHALVLGETLPVNERELLATWMRGNKTGDKRIRAGVPQGWQVADKTGSGAYGTTNDIGVIWPPDRAPIVLAIYITSDAADAPTRDDVVAEATRIVAKTRGARP